MTTDLKQWTLRVDGMTCGGCEANVERVVGKIPGVTEPKASFRSATLCLLAPDDPALLGRVRTRIELAGYTVGSALD